MRCNLQFVPTGRRGTWCIAAGFRLGVRQLLAADVAGRACLRGAGIRPRPDRRPGLLAPGPGHGLYPRWKSPDTRSELAAVAGTWFATTFVLLALGFLTRYGETFPRSTVLAWVLAAPLIDAGSRIAVRQVRRSARQRGIGTRRVAIAGYNRLGLEVAKGLSEEADGSTLQLVGFFDDRAHERLPARQSGIPGLKGASRSWSRPRIDESSI